MRKLPTPPVAPAHHSCYTTCSVSRYPDGVAMHACHKTNVTAPLATAGDTVNLNRRST